MTLSSCDKCKYFDRSPHHSSDIVCGLSPAYANAWKRLASLDEYSRDCLPIDNCREFELDSALEEKAIALNLSISDWQQFAQDSADSSVMTTLNNHNFEINITLTQQQWQSVADSTSIPNIRIALMNEGIEAKRDPWIHINSSCIDAIAYPQGESILKIRFNSGQIYQYDRVPNDVFLSLLDADSKGRFFNRHIRDTYLYTTL